ncbi:MAG: ABC transporter permease [Candidatus Ratteibacteria bacterium]|nr:ABC transporter permease [Candidatus Ratteibacteria bacterium]
MDEVKKEVKEIKEAEKSKKKVTPQEEKLYVASQWRLMWWRFKRHKLAMSSAVVLVIFYLVAVFCEFISPYEPFERDLNYVQAPPQKIHFVDEEGKFHFVPFTYQTKQTLDPETWAWGSVEDKSQRYTIRLFVRGSRYKFWNLFYSDLHLFGVEKGGNIHLLGTDRLGRDMLSRIIYGSRISLSIGLIGVAFSFILGIIFGGIAGYYGGVVDNVIQRIIETLISIPGLPLWMALSAALPATWPSIRVYFGMTVIMSVLGWTGLARVVRGKFLALREEDFVVAARLCGTSEGKIIFKHLLPSFMSHIIVSLTLAVPGMILGETTLSFLNIGLRPPIVSWGVLLNGAQNVQAVAMAPWLLFPALFVIIAVLAFNFLGDGLRDAADPYSTNE